MSSLAHRGVRTLLGAGLVLAAGCADAASLPQARVEEAPGIFGTFVLDPVASEFDTSDPCGAPLSSTLVLEGGTWRTDWRWAPGCREGGAPGEPVTFTRSGRFELRGDTIQLHGADEFEVEEGHVEGETVTIYGHCEGADVYVRKPAEAPVPAPSST